MSVDYSASLYYGIEVSNDWVESLPEEVYITLREEDEYLHRMDSYTDSPVWIFGIYVAGSDEAMATRVDQDKILSAYEELIPCANKGKELGVPADWDYYIGCEVH